MSGYIKLFQSILDSTVWCEPSDTRVVWVTMLASADRDGIVAGSVPSLAKRAGVSMESARRAIEKFLKPDPDSSDPEFEGRRIEKHKSGWRLLNYEKYRLRRSQDDEKNRIRQQRWRDAHRNKNNATGQNYTLRNVIAPLFVEREKEERSKEEREKDRYTHTAVTLANANSDAESIFQKIQQLGFRDSYAIAAQHAYAEHLSKGHNHSDILEKLARIYIWTERGKYVRDLYTAIRRFEEPQHLWERRNGKEPLLLGPGYGLDHIHCVVCGRDMGPPQKGESLDDKLACSEECYQKATAKGEGV